MKMRQRLIVLLQMKILYLIDNWWLAYDFYEKTVLDRPMEYRRMTYGVFWPHFKGAGLWLGDLVQISDKKYLVVGKHKVSAFIAPIQFRRVEEEMELAYFNESYFKDAEVIRHHPFFVLKELKRYYESIVATSRH